MALPVKTPSCDLFRGRTARGVLDVDAATRIARSSPMRQAGSAFEVGLIMGRLVMLALRSDAALA